MNLPTTTRDEPCNTGDCDCHHVDRRQFIQRTGATAAALATIHSAMPVMAGPFEDENEYRKIIPADKKLDPGWLRSLSERGEKQSYTDPAALRHIGMPVGGLFAGTVYLSGDGRLWLWDIFNRDQEGILPRPAPRKEGYGGAPDTRSGLNYLSPAPLTFPFEQGFTLVIGERRRTLDASGFSNVTFDGRYPVGRVSFADDDCPVTVKLQAFSPFVPLNTDDSSLPATLMQYTIENTSDKPVEAELIGHMQNAICMAKEGQRTDARQNLVVREQKMLALVASAGERADLKKTKRPDIVFEDFEKPDYEGWKVEGTSFGKGPVETKDIPSYQGDVGGRGKRVVNSHASAPGSDVQEKDGHVGRLTSKPFKIERGYVHMLVGGGPHTKKTCVNVVVASRVVASATGPENNRMRPVGLDVRKYEGQQAILEIVDNVDGAWGNIGVDEILFSDRPPASDALTTQRDFGTMALALLDPAKDDRAFADRVGSKGVIVPLDRELIGEIGAKLKLAPGEKQTVTFAITWHFPNFYAHGVGGARVGHSYAARFESALDVAQYIAANLNGLAGDTIKWVDTWYDSTLPYWLLDRAMANTSTLATTTCYRFEDGRFWAWEGIGCCPGTCTHVWHYAQAPGRLFPEVERTTRERVDFGLAQHADGGIGMRAWLDRANEPAHDGHCGRILGALREHQTSADERFLRRIWPRVRQAIDFMIARDGNADGMVEGAQPNTLDAAWFGKVPFLASLYLAALRAGETMATEMGDDAFAKKCRTIAERGAESILECFDGEYFVQIEDPKNAKAIGVGPGCYIDQVFGQTWAHWVGLGRLFDRDKQLSALRSLWKYNFVPDVGPFRAAFPRGRWYAAAGDAGLLMCTWPAGGKNPAFADHWQYMYFNECMSGFEWQVAAHMIYEGADEPDLLQNGLAVARAIHDRYDAHLRNPYNEVECSDHYSRAMASYGAFLAACGYEYHGPNGRLGFAPRLSPENFRCPFTAAEGWGTYTQRYDDTGMHISLQIAHGQLTLREVVVQLPEGATSKVVNLTDRDEAAEFHQDGRRVVVSFKPQARLVEGDALELKVET